MLIVLPVIECKLQDMHKSLLNLREIQTDYYFNYASSFVFTLLVQVYIGFCNSALLKLLTVLFIVGCNNRKLYYIEMYCLLLVVTTGNFIAVYIAPNFRGAQFSRIAVFQNFDNNFR